MTLAPPPSDRNSETSTKPATAASSPRTSTTASAATSWIATKTSSPFDILPEHTHAKANPNPSRPTPLLPLSAPPRLQLPAARSTHQNLKLGTPKRDVIAAFKNGNTVKLGTASLDGLDIEEWKTEAFRDRKGGKDLFVAFLYFANDQLVDSSDSRINFRENEAMIQRWKASIAPAR